MKKTILTIAAVAGAMASPNAMAASFVASEYAESRLTYTTIDQVATNRTSGYSGVGTLFISRRSTATTGFGGICTGSLVGGGAVLTAAHCLDTPYTDPITSIQFFLPSLGNLLSGNDTAVFRAFEFALHPDYATTGLVGGNDIALFTVAGDLSGYDTYGLYDGNPLGQFDIVGSGTIGGPRGTNIGIGNDYQKRVGSNIFEYFGDQLFSDSSAGVALYDFDDGTLDHDVFGRNGGNIQFGVANEASSSPGDSGGPSFINGQIAAVTSFGITGGIFNGYCGIGSTDPYNRAGQTTPTALRNCTNSSIGEIGGNTLVSYNRSFVDAYLAGNIRTNAPVPEPTTWLMMLTGFAGIGFAMRRRPRSAAASYA